MNDKDERVPLSYASPPPETPGNRSFKIAGLVLISIGVICCAIAGIGIWNSQVVVYSTTLPPQWATDFVRCVSVFAVGMVLFAFGLGLKSFGSRGRGTNPDAVVSH